MNVQQKNRDMKTQMFRFFIVSLIACTLQAKPVLTVKNGQGSGVYSAGSNVTITAENSADGRIFDRWVGGGGYVVDVYAPETRVTMPTQDLTVLARYRDKLSCGIRDIDLIRQQVSSSLTTTENAGSRRTALYRWWRLLWRQGYDMRSFDHTAESLVYNKNDSTLAHKAITQGFAQLEALSANPVLIKEVRGTPKPTTSETNWPFYMGTDGHQTGYSPDMGPNAGRLAWRFPKGYRWDAYPVLRDGRVYLASPGTDVIGYCLDEGTGDVIWKARQYGRNTYATRGARITPVVTGDRVLLPRRYGPLPLAILDRNTGERVKAPSLNPGSEREVMVRSQYGRNVVLCDARSGRIIWRFITSGPLAGQPVLAGKRVFATERDGTVTCFHTSAKKPIWQYKVGSALQGSPSMGQGCVVVGTRDRRLLALSLSQGTVLWSFQAKDRGDAAIQFFSGANEVEGRIYVGAASAFVYCLDAGNGRLLWKHRVSDWVRSRPFVLGNVVYVATLDGRLVALRDGGESARVLWQVPLGVHGFTVDLAGNAQGILASGRDLILYSVSPKTGYLQWRHGLLDGTWIDGEYVAADWIGGLQPTPTIVDGVVYCGGPDGFVHALHTESGRELWRFETNGTIGVAPTVAADKVFFGQIDGDACYHALDKDSGALIWKSTAFGHVWVAAAYAGDRLFFGNMDGSVFTVDPNTGRTLWQYDTAKDTPKEDWPRHKRGHGYPPGVYSNPVADDTAFYVGSWSGYYFAFDQETGRMLWRTQTNNGNPTGGLPDSAAPMLHKNHLYVQKIGHIIAALDKKDGRIVWEWQAPVGYLQNGTVAAHGDMVFGSIVRHVVELPYNATIVAFKDVENGGDKLWEYNGGAGLTAPVLTEDKLIFGSSADVFLTCLSPKDGFVRWRFHTGGQMLENVPALYGNKVFAHCKNGWLFAVE